MKNAKNYKYFAEQKTNFVTLSTKLYLLLLGVRYKTRLFVIGSQSLFGNALGKNIDRKWMQYILYRGKMSICFIKVTSFQYTLRIEK
jgi:hypothetical protein